MSDKRRTASGRVGVRRGCLALFSRLAPQQGRWASLWHAVGWSLSRCQTGQCRASESRRCGSGLRRMQRGKRARRAILAAHFTAQKRGNRGGGRGQTRAPRRVAAARTRKPHTKEHYGGRRRSFPRTPPWTLGAAGRAAAQKAAAAHAGVVALQRGRAESRGRFSRATPGAGRCRAAAAA